MSAAGGPVAVRFAPSPTGLIHLGNARTALYNWFLARRNGGTFILRFDDTDQARSREEFAEAIARDLDWLGVAPDRVEKQSARLDVYARAAETLKAAGLLYACYDTPDELERQRRRQRARGLPPVYDRHALKLSPAEKAAFEAEGRAPHWRFLLPNFSDDPFAPEHTEIVWDDLVRGRQAIDLSSLSDPVLVRADGTSLYTFTSVADDVDLGITHVVRGDDHVTNTAVQIALFRALGAEPPVFGHHNLLQGEGGEGMSKRDAALSLRSFREEGIEPQAVAAFAALIGTSEPVHPYATLEEIAARFNLAKVNQAPARFSPQELRALNAKLVGELPYEAVAERLTALGVGGGAAFWEAVRGNVPTVAGAAPWWEVVTGPVTSAADEADAPFLARAASLLPEEPWDGTTWSLWTNALKAASGRRGRDLFLPLRLALTGLSSGPELAALLPLIGRPNTLARLPAPAGPSGR